MSKQELISDLEEGQTITFVHKGTKATLISGRVFSPTGAHFGYELAGISTPKKNRGKGHATIVMQAIMDAADEANVWLDLQPIPSSDSPLDESDLERWYERFGFKKFKHDIMYRQPRTT